jgi:hypothetical protein
VTRFWTQTTSQHEFGLVNTSILDWIHLSAKVASGAAEVDVLPYAFNTEQHDKICNIVTHRYVVTSKRQVATTSTINHHDLVNVCPKRIYLSVISRHRRTDSSSLTASKPQDGVVPQALEQRQQYYQKHEDDEA